MSELPKIALKVRTIQKKTTKNIKMRQKKVKKCEICGKSFIIWVGKGHRIPRKQFVIPTRSVNSKTCSSKCSEKRRRMHYKKR